MRDRWLICLLIAGHANAGGLLFAGAGARSGGWAEIQESGNIVLSRQNAQNVSLASASSADLQLDLPLSPDSAYHLWAAQSRHSLLPFNAGQLRIRYAQLGGINHYPAPGNGLRPFLAGAIGVSDIQASQFESRLYPSGSLAGGLDIPLSPLLTVRLETRVTAIAVTSEYVIQCGGGCSAQINSGTWSQWSAAALLGLRF